MKSLIRFNEEDFLEAIIDTRYDLEIVDIVNDNLVINKLNKIYGKKNYVIKNNSIFIEGNKSVNKERYCIGDLKKIMDVLTGENGCPWDKVQTHESIRINAVEEAYELVEAINKKDIDNIEEETGDLLLQAVFHANIARRANEFDYFDVITHLCKKLVSRHTHIFGNNKATSPEEALKSWEDAKAIEKSEESLNDKINRIPKTYPGALMFQKTLKKLFKGGLINDAPKATKEQLIVVLAGAIANDIDLEVELLKEVNAIKNEYLTGKIKKISEHK